MDATAGTTFKYTEEFTSDSVTARYQGLVVAKQAQIVTSPP